MSRAVYHVGDTVEVVRSLPENSVDLVLTSPPFLALRSYLPADHPAKDKEIGSEPTPAEFIDTLLMLVAEWDRVLAPHGSIAVELGDTYAGSGGAGGDYADGGMRAGQNRFTQSRRRDRAEVPRNMTGGDGWPLAKSLCGIPQLFEIALAYGINPLTGAESPAGKWRVRNMVAWCRPNPAVGALGDKYRPATSYMTIATRATDRYFDLDAVRVPASQNTNARNPKGVDVKPRTAKAAPDVNPTADATRPPYDHVGLMDGEADLFLEDGWLVSTESYSGSHYACVDADTEALTPDGWRRHDLLADGSLIAAYDPGSDAIRWQPATIHRYPFDGELVAFNQRETVQRLTPNHRVLHLTGRGNMDTRRADEAVPSWRVPLAAQFDVKGAGGPGVEMAALLGWYIAEGSESSTNTIRIYQSNTANPQHVARIRSLLVAANADYDERRRVRPVGASLSPRESTEVTFVVRGVVARWLIDHAPGKRLTGEPLGWSDAECNALLDALIDGDGHTRTDGRRQFIQKDKETIDNVQALVCRLGSRSTLSAREDGGWSLTIGGRRWASLRGTNGESKAIERKRYVGTVWCPAVESTYWLARRSGRPFITGNTWPRKLLDRPILSMCPQKVCIVCGEPSRRITGDPTYKSGDGKPVDPHVWESGMAEGKGAHTGKKDGGVTRHAETVGWTDCGHDNSWRRGVVLDPFGGSGTTGVVAVHHGRDAILIDLDERNVDLARERIGMFMEVAS